jgi:hypothetical protein
MVMIITIVGHEYIYVYIYTYIYAVLEFALDLTHARQVLYH